MRSVMDGLLPIIRRVRRPLVPVDGTAGGADAKPAVAAPKPEVEPALGTVNDRRKVSDDKATAPQGRK